MREIGHVALNTYRETVRDKVLYNLVLFALLMISSSYVLGKISVYQEGKITKDLGLASISIFGMVIAIFIGISLVSKEIDKRTLYGVLPRCRVGIVQGVFQAQNVDFHGFGCRNVRLRWLGSPCRGRVRDI